MSVRTKAGSVWSLWDDEVSDFEELDSQAVENIWSSNGKFNTPTSSIINGRKRRKVCQVSELDGPGAHSLNILPTMPIDVLYEIFTHLAPVDLLNLSRTTKGLRQLLMSKRSISVWTTARKATPDAPDCPSDLSEPQWADLVWGSKACQQCNRGAVSMMKAALFLRRRACMQCLSDHLITVDTFSLKFPDYDRVIMDLIPHAQVTSPHTKTWKYFWDDDIVAMNIQLSRCRKAAISIPGAEEALTRFTSSRAVQIRAYMQHAEICAEWASQRGYLR